MNYNRLINKYYTSDGKNMAATPKRHKHEQTSKEYTKKQKNEYNLRKRQSILTELLYEVPFQLNNNQVKQIRYWIQQFNKEFKDFHRQSSNETIILAMIMIQRKQTNPKLNVEKFTISKKYHLTNPIFILIQNRLIFKLMKTTPLQYNQKKQLDNHILNKKGY